MDHTDNTEPGATDTPVTDTVSEQAEALAVQAASALDTVQGLYKQLSQPWALYQLGIIIALIAAALVLRTITRPALERLVGSLTRLPVRMQDFLLFAVSKTHLAYFAALAFVTAALMREVFRWPSRSYLISIAAEIALALFLIGVFATLIRNRTVRKLAAWAAWIFATLRIVGLWDETAAFLEATAIDTGGVRISLMMVLTAIVTLAVLFALAGFFSKSVTRQIERADDMSSSIKVLLTKVAQLGFYAAAFFIGLSVIGFDLSNLALLSGAIGLGIGFGLQKIVSNLVSGVIILLDKSIKPGDVISLDGTFGWITQLGARYASVTTRDGREYLIPNEDFITNQVVNWSHSSDLVRLDIHFGVSYDSDPHLVKKVAAEAPLSVDRVVTAPAPVCHIINFGDSSIDFKLRFWIKDPTGGLTNIRGNVYLALWDTLKEHGVEIPYPRRDVHMYHAPADQTAVAD